MSKVNLDTLRRTPAYPFVEAAHYLNVSVSTLRSWCVGTTYGPAGDKKTFKPVIALDGEPHEGLSFLNLVEAHVLVALRRKHRITLPKIREALLYIGTKLGMDRPLADARFQTDGVDLLVEHLDELVNVSRDGQWEMATLLPQKAFGRPVLVGRSVPTAVLADRFKAGDPLSQLADDFEIPTEKIEEAIRCELDRRKAA